MIIRMIADILEFLFIYILQLMAFALVASMAFVQIKEFNGFYPTLLYLFNASFGSYNLSLFDQYEKDEFKYLGQAFLIIFIFVNLVLLLNMVIAMMADTYALMTEISKGVYNNAVLQVQPQYKNNKYYGGLIAATMPLNVPVFFLSPLFLIISNKSVLKSLTFGVKMFNYFFIMMPIVALFMALNAICLPFAYLRTVFIKFKLATKGVTGCGESLIFLLIGIPLLFAYQLFDLVDFIKWSTMMEDPNEKQDKHYIQKSNFELFYQILKGLEECDEEIPARALVVLLSELFDTTKHIFVSINGNEPTKPITYARKA